MGFPPRQAACLPLSFVGRGALTPPRFTQRALVTFVGARCPHPPVWGVSRRRRKGGLRRVTFPNSWKSDQKNQKKPMVSSLPCALCIVQNCKCLPHVRARHFVSFHCRIDTAPAPLPLTGAPKELLRLSRGPTGSSAPTQCCRSHFRRARCPHRAAEQRFISYCSTASAAAAQEES